MERRSTEPIFTGSAAKVTLAARNTTAQRITATFVNLPIDFLLMPEGFKKNWGFILT